ncbi:patatin-like phospholipase family protein [Persicobacter psychrovividus]|uniref:PNPLA domain-containing protein n=1 Tax=Persicobacter psychrovividus TaxID=387638 RepID=A0ABM7VIT4_9BACT|nr:hypothetical protein PEPS_29620 [Persicobacter psychrovividus]
MLKHKLLTIDGGGTRGVIPATILMHLEEYLQGKQAGKSLNHYFDLVMGTSTGGIIALAIGAGIPMRAIRDLYLKEASEIFKDSIFDDLRDGFWNLFGADYTQKVLSQKLQAEFEKAGVTTMGEINRTSRAKILVAAFHLNPAANEQGVHNFRPRIFNSWFRRDSDLPLYKIGCATSAGPTFFPVYGLNDHRYIDGGVAMNNPAMAAVSFAMNKNIDPSSTAHGGPEGQQKGLGKSIHELALLSLGTGTSNTAHISAEQVGKGDWGAAKWINHMSDLLTEANMQSTAYYVEQLFHDNKDYLRVNFNLADPKYQLNLKDGEAIKIDETDPQRLQQLVDIADRYWEEHQSELKSFFDRTADESQWVV